MRLDPLRARLAGRPARVPNHQQLVVADGAEDVGVLAVPGDVLDNRAVALVNAQGVEHLQTGYTIGDTIGDTINDRRYVKIRL